MDDIVRQAMQKWPAVPACYGWLGLDKRGDWYLRDAHAQAAGAFQSGVPGAKGSRLEHAGLIAFIERNYACDDRGFWYFQNGPQRVFVELEAAPWILRISPDYRMKTHDGRDLSAWQLVIDAQGWLFAVTERGLALLHSQDMVLAADAIETRAWPVEEMPSHVAGADGIAQHYGFVRSPAQGMTGLSL